MLIRTTRFGDLDIEASVVLHFPHGLPGFPEETRFVLLPYDADSPFAFLQSTVEPDLAFLVVDPFAFFPAYEFTLSEQLTAELGLSPECPPKIYSIVTVPEKTEDLTANLIAPVIINPKKQLARQTVLEKTSYTTRHRLFPARVQKPAKGGE